MGFKADSNKKIKFKEPAYKLRPADNPLSWKFLMNLPGLNENNATQIGALYSMLGGIDDNDLDMTPLKPWMEMMDFSFNEIYCICGSFLMLNYQRHHIHLLELNENKRKGKK